MKIQSNILLKDHTTFKIGGPAKFFIEVKGKEELAAALKYAQDNKLKYFILGGGSNILVSDQGFGGLVIRIVIDELKTKKNIIKVGSGMSLAGLVKDSIENSLSGLEALAGIPGTVGGAIYGNAGSFGKQIGDFIDKVVVFDAKSGSVFEMKKNDCQFGYRDSIFKKKSELVILGAELILASGDRKELEKKFNEYLEQKNKSLDWCASAGCVFKNIELKKLSKDQIEKLKQAGADLAPAQKVGKIAAGYLIDFLGLKGFKIGNAAISEKHANFIINLGNARAEEVVILESVIKEKVRNNLGLQLESEQILIGF